MHRDKPSNTAENNTAAKNKREAEVIAKPWTPEKPVYNANLSSNQESFYDSSGLSNPETRGLRMMQVEPCQFAKEANVSETKDAESQTKQLEKGLINILETNAGEEGPTAVGASKAHEFTETSKAEKLYKGFPTDDDHLSYNETTRKEDKTNLGANETVPESKDTHINELNSDPSKSLLVDNYVNRLVENEMKDVEDEDMLSNTDLPTPNYDQVTPPVPESSVTEELEKILGEDVEEFEQIKNNTSTALLEQRILESEDILLKVEKVPDNLSVNHPSENIANLIGNISILTGRTKTKDHNLF